MTLRMLAQVTYPTWLAGHLHRIPLTLALGLPLLLPGTALGAQAPLSTKYAALLKATLVGLLGTVGSILLPALYSAAFVTITGGDLCLCSTPICDDGTNQDV